MRLEQLDGDPYLRLVLPSREPLCGACDKPIAWQLEAFTFMEHPDRRLAHARCVMSAQQLQRESDKARHREEHLL